MQSYDRSVTLMAHALNVKLACWFYKNFQSLHNIFLSNVVTYKPYQHLHLQNIFKLLISINE